MKKCGILFLFCWLLAFPLQAQDLLSSVQRGQSALSIAEDISEVLPGIQAELPEGIQRLAVWFVYNEPIDENSRVDLEGAVRQQLQDGLTVEVAECDECGEIEYIQEGDDQVRIVRGISNLERRQRLAKELEAQSILMVSVYDVQEKQSILFQVYPLDDKPFTFSRSLTQAPQIVNVFAGVMNLLLNFESTQRPSSTDSTRRVKNADLTHSAFVVGVELPVLEISPNFFGGKTDAVASVLMFRGQTEGLGSGLSEFSDAKNLTGIVLEGGVAYTRGRLTGTLGLAQVLSDPINNPNYLKLGGRADLTQQLNLSFAYLFPISSGGDSPTLLQGFYATLGWYWR